MTGRRALLVALALALAPAAAGTAGAQTLAKIRKQGAVTLGYIDGGAPFSFADGKGEPQGYSVDICRAVAAGLRAQLKRDDLKTRWVRLTIQNRIDAVRRGRVDVECSTTTWTLGRQELVDFSLVTFVDGASILAKAGTDVSHLSDYNGKRIAVIPGTTTEKVLRDALAQRSIKAEVVTVKTRDEGLALLNESKVEGLASDRTTLIGVVTRSPAGGVYKLLDEDFSIEPYALMLPRGDHDLRLAVNRVLARLYRSGEIRPIYDRWLGPLGPPSLLLSASYFIQGLSE
ncbi:MAG TPA: amino acid ABC transporter substrate-binding protein [Burkholderiales bacterium]|nr:amino acid ABC transporter substrate-binding protein [Burkholderiales bacterium]